MNKSRFRGFIKSKCVLVGSLLFIVACGEDSESVANVDYSEYNYVWESQSDFKECNSTINGWAAYNRSQKSVFVCEFDKSLEEWAWIEHPDWLPNAESSSSENFVDDEEKSSSSEVYSSNSSVNSSPSRLTYDGEFGSFKDARNKDVYKTVVIGNQIWMAENLRYKTSSSYCYQNKEENCGEYGRLYDWSDARIACPNGWHLPSDSEWVELFTYVGESAAFKLKSVNEWDDGAGVDEFGFGALPAGYKKGSEYVELGSYAGFWSSDYYDSGNAYSWRFLSSDDNEKRNSLSKTILRSVRCVSDSVIAGGAEEPSSSDAKSSSSIKSSSSTASSGTEVDFVFSTVAQLQNYPCNSSREGMSAYVEDFEIFVECQYDEDLERYMWTEDVLYEYDVPSSSSRLSSSSVRSSSSTASSSSAKSSSSIASSSSAKSSSSIASSSSAKSSSSIASSSSAKSSSSIASSSSIKSSSSISVTVGTFKDTRDNYVYKTVTIETQTWMAENLRYNATNSVCYKDDALKCESDGRLYDWEIAMTACPSGWHLPSDDDWTVLRTNIGMENSGALMRAASSRWSSPGDDAYGMSILPSGLYSYEENDFFEYDHSTFLWSSTPSETCESTCAGSLYIDSNTKKAGLGNMLVKAKISVRCVKD